MGKDTPGKCKQEWSRNCFAQLSDSRIWGVNHYQHHEYHFMCFCNSPCEYMCTYEYASCIFKKMTYNKLVLYDLWNKTRYQICSTTRLLSWKHFVISTSNGTFSIKKKSKHCTENSSPGFVKVSCWPNIM